MPAENSSFEPNIPSHILYQVNFLTISSAMLLTTSIHHSPLAFFNTTAPFIISSLLGLLAMGIKLASLRRLENLKCNEQTTFTITDILAIAIGLLNSVIAFVPGHFIQPNMYYFFIALSALLFMIPHVNAICSSDKSKQPFFSNVTIYFINLTCFLGTGIALMASNQAAVISLTSFQSIIIAVNIIYSLWYLRKPYTYTAINNGNETEDSPDILNQLKINESKRQNNPKSPLNKNGIESLSNIKSVSDADGKENNKTDDENQGLEKQGVSVDSLFTLGDSKPQSGLHSQVNEMETREQSTELQTVKVTLPSDKNNEIEVNLNGYASDSGASTATEDLTTNEYETESESDVEDSEASSSQSGYNN